MLSGSITMIAERQGVKIEYPFGTPMYTASDIQLINNVAYEYIYDNKNRPPEGTFAWDVMLESQQNVDPGTTWQGMTAFDTAIRLVGAMLESDDTKDGKLYVEYTLPVDDYDERRLDKRRLLIAKHVDFSGGSGGYGYAPAGFAAMAMGNFADGLVVELQKMAKAGKYNDLSDDEYADLLSTVSWFVRINTLMPLFDNKHLNRYGGISNLLLMAANLSTYMLLNKSKTIVNDMHDMLEIIKTNVRMPTYISCFE